MKSIVKAEKEVKNIPFPKLMKSTINEAIVLFYKDGEGIVVSNSNDGEYRLGYLSSTWIMQNFRDFNGSITLQN